MKFSSLAFSCEAEHFVCEFPTGQRNGELLFLRKMSCWVHYHQLCTKWFARHSKHEVKSLLGLCCSPHSGEDELLKSFQFLFISVYKNRTFNPSKSKQPEYTVLHGKSTGQKGGDAREHSSTGSEQRSPAPVSSANGSHW